MASTSRVLNFDGNLSLQTVWVFYHSNVYMRSVCLPCSLASSALVRFPSFFHIGTWRLAWENQANWIMNEWMQAACLARYCVYGVCVCEFVGQSRHVHVHLDILKTQINKCAWVRNAKRLWWWLCVFVMEMITVASIRTTVSACVHFVWRHACDVIYSRWRPYTWSTTQYSPTLNSVVGVQMLCSVYRVSAWRNTAQLPIWSDCRTVIAVNFRQCIWVNGV